MAECKNCGKVLRHNEIGLHKRMINRGAESFMCIGCLAEYFGCSTEMLEKKIIHFKNQGCLLFTDEE
ncbi:MAG: hypothetical protein J6B93_03125 [Clostridia bacterium]|nr:hypothetical protein [Clostridia bacterium]